MAKLTYKEPGTLGKKTPLNHYQKMMALLGFSVAMNVASILWLILSHLKN